MTDDKKKSDTIRLVESKDHFIKCPIHGIRYPTGANCPACEAAKLKGS